LWRQVTLQQLHRRGGGGVLMAEHSTAQQRRRGCGGRPTDAEPRKSPPEQTSTGRNFSKLTGADRATRARSIVAKLGGRCRRWGAMPMNPSGQKVGRNELEQRRQRAAANLTGACRSWTRDVSATRVARGARVRVLTERVRE
jgi:hypothetical protein